MGSQYASCYNDDLTTVEVEIDCCRRTQSLSCFEYDVFLSFEGEGTRRGFTSHLYSALGERGIKVCMPDERRDQISENRLMQSIESSQIYIPIISRGYFESKDCPQELAKMLKCNKSLTIPIFYNVGDEEDGHQDLIGELGSSKQETRDDPTAMRTLGEAPQKAAARNGFDLRQDANGHEARLVQMVVDRVVQLISSTMPAYPMPLIGVINPLSLRFGPNIISYLRDSNVPKMALCGMGGVGKTFLMQCVYHTLHRERDWQFDPIIFLSVPYQGTVKHLRNEIAKRLFMADVIDHVDDELEAARLLNSRLSKCKYLLILDDLWTRFDLEKIGIPEPTNENGCKLVVTTRIHNVCLSMGIGAVINVTALPSDDAWDLFLETVGNLPDMTEPIARMIVECCAGLPLAIVAAAEFLRNQRDKLAWFAAFDKLVNAQPISRCMKDSVFDSLRLSYDRLESHLLKQCFLSCVFYIDSFTVTLEELADYLAAEGLVAGKNFIKLHGYHLLKTLVNNGLLEEKRDNRVAINGVVRSMVLRMMSGKFISRNQREVEDAPNEKEWEVAEKVSLRHTLLSELSDKENVSPNSPELNSLLLGGSSKLKYIPDDFFRRMELLLLLDLSFTKISTLPTSVSMLRNLRFLSLKGCLYLKTIDQVVDLESLMFLNLDLSPVRKLPKEISRLINLRTLLLNGTINLVEVECGAIAPLSCLQKFHMEGSAYVWSLEATNKEAGLQEIGCIPCLEDLKLNVACDKDFENIKDNAKSIWNHLLTLKCYIKESSKVMEFDLVSKTWTLQIDKDPSVDTLSRSKSIRKASGKQSVCGCCTKKTPTGRSRACRKNSSHDKVVSR